MGVEKYKMEGDVDPIWLKSTALCLHKAHIINQNSLESPLSFGGILHN